MGTMVSLRFAGVLPAAPVLHDVNRCFDESDRRFSLHRPDSELSRVAAGHLVLSRASAELRQAYTEALDWRRRTDGAFTPHRPDGIVDLNGIVKAQTMAAAARMLDAAGQTDWLLNVGGDLVGRGKFTTSPWQVGILDPVDRSALLCTLMLSPGRSAVATSGTAERGEHIWRYTRTHTGPDAAYRQVTVRAADIVTADVLATAIVAGGVHQRDEALDRFDIDVLTVDELGALTATAAFQTAPGLAPV
ncbi:FAD:protein FMN transferase [Cryobacterium adonitolivorans]|uniref:FAD:protein FMN transferase n=2 Tax=Cryobacterium adonitolivorans TaxID=1259189 RepID=A0A4R8W5B7_9MICO|nr:FAD:protein FMN transferase [Cryobacterium adonitolivorans]